MESSPVDRQWTLSQESAVSQVGNPQASPEDNALSQAESAFSQAGNPRGFPSGQHSLPGECSFPGRQPPSFPRRVQWFPRKTALHRQRVHFPRQATPVASPVDSTLSQESAVSQVGNPQASPEDSRECIFPGRQPPGFPSGQHSLPGEHSSQRTALSQSESQVLQAGNPQVTPAVRCSARLRALHASQNSNSQAGSSQAGKPPGRQCYLSVR